MRFASNQLLSRARIAKNNHVFHKLCILQWNKINLACPVCRVTYYPPSKEESCALRNYENPTLQDVVNILNFNPWQIKFVTPDGTFADNFMELWQLAISKAPQVINSFESPPGILRYYAISVKPITVAYLIPRSSFKECWYALFLDMSILPDVAHLFRYFQQSDIGNLMFYCVQNKLDNIRYFDIQFGYDYVLNKNPDLVKSFRRITFETCVQVITKYKHLIAYCMSRITNEVWLQLLDFKFSLIKYYNSPDLNVVLHALRINLRAYFYLNWPHRNSKVVTNFILTKSNGKFIKHLPQTLANCQFAYDCDPGNLRFIKSKTKRIEKWKNSLNQGQNGTL